jgi:hypothetical protein
VQLSAEIGAPFGGLCVGPEEGGQKIARNGSALGSQVAEQGERTPRAEAGDIGRTTLLSDALALFDAGGTQEM